MECTGGISGKIKTIIIPTNGLAKNNFIKHLKTNNVDKIKAMFKRGSLKKIV